VAKLTFPSIIELAIQMGTGNGTTLVLTFDIILPLKILLSILLAVEDYAGNKGQNAYFYVRT
jgi:hypothetical protein